jgi:hypothetical protein
MRGKQVASEQQDGLHHRKTEKKIAGRVLPKQD